jgi:hypothetical protein
MTCPWTARRGRGLVSALSIGLAAFVTARPGLASEGSHAGGEPRRATARLVLKLGALPQIHQHISDTEVWAELYEAELLVPTGRRWRAGGGVLGRGDFLLVRGALAHDVWRSRDREWRAAAGVEYLVPLSETESLYRRMKGEGSSTIDRSNVYFGIGQTFNLDRERMAFRVEYAGRVTFDHSVLSLLESLDDELGSGEGGWVHEFAAGIELQLGSLR